MTRDGESYMNNNTQSGENFEQAIVLKDLRDQEATRKLYQILGELYGVRGEDWTLVKQELLDNEIGIFDKMTIKLRNNEITSVYFNITDTIGKEFL